jgi:hypothetical protein
VLTYRGLGPALEVLADHSHLPVEVTAAHIPRRLPTTVEAVVYYLAAEELQYREVRPCPQLATFRLEANNRTSFYASATTRSWR